MDDKRSQARRQELQALKPAGPISAALYARVSSERQVADLTIASQVDALRERMAADGLAVVRAVDTARDQCGTTRARLRQGHGEATIQSTRVSY